MSILWKERKRTFLGLPLSFTVYKLNEERLFIESGFFTTKEDEIRLYRILDISLSRTLGQRIFGLGTIHCCSSDKTLGDFDIKNIKNAHAVKEMLSELVEKQRVEKRVSNRELLGHDDLDDYDHHEC